MTSNKCRHCGLVNAVWDRACRRCGYICAEEPRREAAKPSSALYMLLAVTLIGGAVYYVYTGLERSYGEVQANEANRIAAQPKHSPLPLTSRSEYDQGRTVPYKNAIANSEGLAASQKRNEEAKRLMQNKSQQ